MLFSKHRGAAIDDQFNKKKYIYIPAKKNTISISKMLSKVNVLSCSACQTIQTELAKKDIHFFQNFFGNHKRVPDVACMNCFIWLDVCQVVVASYWIRHCLLSSHPFSCNFFMFKLTIGLLNFLIQCYPVQHRSIKINYHLTYSLHNLNHPDVKFNYF